MKDTRPKPENQIWVLRVITDSCRYRLEFSPSDTYQKVLDKIVQKTGYDLNTIEVCNNNSKRLNIQPQRKLKDVVYLNHGAILLVRQLDSLKNSAMKSRASFLSADTKTSGKLAQTSEKNFFSPQKAKCTHPPNGKCLQCLSEESKKQVQANQFLNVKKEESKQLYNECAHGPNIKCLKCFDKPNKPPEKTNNVQKIVLSPSVKFFKKNVPETAQVTKCKHSSKISCPRCIVTPKRMSKITLLNPQKSPKSTQKDVIPLPNLAVTPKKYIKSQQTKPVKKCDHGPNGKCLNCIIIEKQSKKESIQVCEHGPNAKCLKCLSKDSPKPAHIPFDQYLATRQLNCKHSKEKSCPNCLPFKNLRLKIDKNCKKHAPYPKSLCTSCMPENISIKRQEYRHVDYVQFMNHDQIQNFIYFWIRQKGKKQMRVAFLYGYYAEDPYYKNGIRAIVQALYEPHQHCTDKLFWITDQPKRKFELQMLISSLGLQKIGFVMTTNNPQMPFNDAYIRFLSKMQQQNSVTHQTGYRLSNMFTMVIGEKIKDGVATIQPQIYMVSDQAQALQTAGLFISNKQNLQKMKIVGETPEGQLLPSVYLGGKEVKQFQIEYLLVKIAAGRDKQSKFAILKNNQFLTSSRGSIKGRKVGQYLIKTKKIPNNVRFGDLNLLIFISQTLGIETALQIANNVAQQKQIDEPIWALVERQLSKYI